LNVWGGSAGLEFAKLGSMKFLMRFLCICGLIAFVACNMPFGKEDPVVVSVGSAKLHLSEIQKLAPEWDSWNNQERLKFLENWIDEETMYQEAVENGTDKDPVLSMQIEQAVRKMVVDQFLENFADTMVVGDAEKIDFYHAHPELFLRGKTSISGALIFFRDWQSGDQYYRGHKNLKYDSLPGPHYLIKKIETFESVTETPDSCMITSFDSVEVGMLTKMKYCGGALKIAVVTSKLDSADVLPYEEVAEEVGTQAWLVHRAEVMDRLKKEWKMERPIFSKTDVFSEKEK
jgi:hypothetical protein